MERLFSFSLRRAPLVGKEKGCPFWLYCILQSVQGILKRSIGDCLVVVSCSSVFRSSSFRGQQSVAASEEERELTLRLQISL